MIPLPHKFQRPRPWKCRLFTLSVPPVQSCLFARIKRVQLALSLYARNPQIAPSASLSLRRQRRSFITFAQLACSSCSRKPTPLISLVCYFSTEKFPRKEVIQPHLPVRLPCYDFTPVTNPALGRCSLTVSSRTSGVVDFHGVTGGVYKTRERIQRSVLICVY